MKIAVVDIGSNTVKMKIYTYSDNVLTEIFSSVKYTKLISYIIDGKMSDEGIFLLCENIAEFKEQAKKHSPDIFKCFATASLRKSSNIEKIISEVSKICNEKIELISGNDEAFYSFSGVKNTSQKFTQCGIVVDMGGGSTEIVYYSNREMKDCISLNFGSLSLYLDFTDKDKSYTNYNAIQEYAISCLKNTRFENIKSEDAFIVGGTAIAISKLYNYKHKTSDNSMLYYDKLCTMYDELINDKNTVFLLNKLVPKRANTVLTGLAAYIAIFKKYGIQNIHLSTCGIREGFVFENILKLG